MFRENITQFTTRTSNHADNFNKVHNELLENTKHNKSAIDELIAEKTKPRVSVVRRKIVNGGGN